MIYCNLQTLQHKDF